MIPSCRSGVGTSPTPRVSGREDNCLPESLLRFACRRIADTRVFPVSNPIDVPTFQESDGWSGKIADGLSLAWLVIAVLRSGMPTSRKPQPPVRFRVTRKAIDDFAGLSPSEPHWHKTVQDAQSTDAVGEANSSRA